jgi:hypothetical protein
MAISFEWDKDFRGNEILLVRKTRGKISISELQEGLSKNYNFLGGWAVIIKATEEAGYQCVPGAGELKGDVVELRRVDDWEDCPICAAVLAADYCPHCGEHLIKKERET